MAQTSSRLSVLQPHASVPCDLDPHVIDVATVKENGIGWFKYEPW